MRGTTSCDTYTFQLLGISIHVPREGHDAIIQAAMALRFAFLSTCPVRGTTCNNYKHALTLDISIHVPREGHDLVATRT